MFEIIKGFDQVLSRVCDDVLAEGTVMQEKTDRTKAEAATNDFFGILTQNVTASGPAFELVNAGIPLNEVAVGNAVTIRGGEGWIATDVVALDTDTGALDSATVNCEVGISGGKFREAQAGDKVYGYLREKDYKGTTDLMRIEFFKTGKVVA